MAYTSLYRRYRPTTFDKVIGQDHIVRTLKNQIAKGSVGHAYIFTGTRGTGKTTVAKIFARAVNCLHPVDGSPCGECEVCKQLALQGNFDIVEMDAASNNSVDQMRELTDKINYAPAVGRYKVYIVDEVHMLSKGAFNALLKTLEEPPEHAIFILATTEVHQIPATILSRCLRFDFRLVPTATIAKRLGEIFDDIGVKCEKEAAELIAEAGAGSVRDALSIADTCVSYCDGNITYDGVLEVLGASDPQKLIQLAKCIIDSDVDGALKCVAHLCDLGKSVPVLAKDLAATFKNLLYIKQCSDAEELLNLPASVYSGLKEIAATGSAAKFLRVMRSMCALEGEFRYSSQHRVIFEGAVSEACLGNVEDRLEELTKRVLRLEKSGGPRNFNSAPAIMDARQVWIHVASVLKAKHYDIIVTAAEGAQLEMTDTEFIFNVSDNGAMLIFNDRNNREAIVQAFASVKEAGGRIPVFREVLHLGEDKAIPYIKEMFGDMLELN